MLLALNKVEGDNISGVCFVGLYDLDALRYFVLAPLCVGVIVGLFLILAGIVSLNNVRQVIQHDERNQEKLKKFMIRIGIFSCLYLVPLVTLLACYTYEQSYRSTWEKTWIYDHCLEYSIPCPYEVATYFLQQLVTGAVLFCGLFHGKMKCNKGVIIQPRKFCVNGEVHGGMFISSLKGQKIQKDTLKKVHSVFLINN